MSIYKYWTICKIDGGFHRSGSRRGYQARELPVVKKQFQQWFPSYCETHELPGQQDQEIQTQLLSEFLHQDSTNFEPPIPPSWVIAGLSLRCYISHAIVYSCQKLAQQFGHKHGFSELDLLPIMLTDDGRAWIGLDSDRKTQFILDRLGSLQPSTYPLLSVEILRTFDPTRGGLAQWACLRTRQHEELTRTLWIEYGVLLETPWSKLNQVQGHQWKILSPHERHWVEVFHQVYRRDRREQGARGKCPTPSETQLQEMRDRLLQVGIIAYSSDEMLDQFKRIAQFLQQRKMNPSPPPSPPDPPVKEFLKTVLNEARDQALLNAIERVLFQRLSQLKKKAKSAEIADNFFPGLRLIYFEAKSQGEVARVLNMNNQSQVSRFFNLKEMLAKIREQVGEELLQILLSKEGFNSVAKDANAFNHLIQQLSDYLDETVFLEALRELQTGRYRKMTSLFAEKMRDYLSSNDVNPDNQAA
ncbi:hypothetical protein ACL6C3_25275 [Capilliphycus salinus ALCB114379]|uniref:hypothetical protein n=1 Tax=Capilliphycus salinus TaxID=2768948 RepID=UPI0039A6E222